MRASAVDIPDTSKPIDIVTSNRKPLLSSPFAKLPLGSVLPHGWIKHQLYLMVHGQVGRLKEVSHFLADDNGWFSTENDGWEEQAYWFRGFYDLGVITGDERIRNESKTWIEAIIASQQEDGYFGPPTMKCVNGNDGSKAVDLWPHMVMIDALRSHWEATNDSRVIELLTAFFRYCLQIPEESFIPTDIDSFGNWRVFVQLTRAGDMLPHIYWLYNKTGEEWLLDAAERFHKHVSPPEGEFLCKHIVNFTQRFRESGNYYLQSHDPEDLAETEKWYQQHMSVWGQQPGGGFAADEIIREGKTDPKQGFETCGMVEFNKSFYILGQVTGQALYADRVEDIVFNSFPASQTPDLKGLHYLTAANLPQLDASQNHDYWNKYRQLDYSPHEIYRCCQHNVAMGWPYYVEHMWMAAAGGGVVAWMYGPSQVTVKLGGQFVKIVEDTNYPFKTDVRMIVSTDEDAYFPLYLRVPGWCDGFNVKVNGEDVNVSAAPGQFLLIERAWQNGDVIEIKMPVKLSVKKWEKSCGSVTVNRGPLSYSVKIGEEWKTTATGTEEWPDWEVFPTTPWNYGLVFNPDDLDASFEVVEHRQVEEQPWTVQSAPVEIKARAKRIPNWKMIDETVTDLQPSPIRSGEPVEEITMIPMGCAHLRMSCLPVIGEGEDASEWKVVESHEEAMRLRLVQSSK